ncbi:hydroxyacylglutathione hydrolase, cytoplasmic isozyme [Trichomonascus vanleenenianus]|uniref:hydroxyacylglutathione hydrolase GLO2 n=1 Tax=Trichomonascus vanleenenianus TaxID=2268995 RepID=UPI003ECA10E4
MHIQALPMRWGRGDNYAYLIRDDVTKEATIIDPAEVKDILSAVQKQQKSGKINLASIINTHHHYDHAGGNAEMLTHFDVPVIAGKDSEKVTRVPGDKSVFTIGENIEVTAIHTPCHTQDSICYYFVDKKTGERAVFTGDTLFTAGCGRFFEGSAQEMLSSLNKLGELPADTKVYPGHEYTAGNVKFAKTVLDNDALAKLDKYTRENKHTTGVFTIGDEKTFNPFMMTSNASIQKRVGERDAVAVMARLREMKNAM